MKQSLEFIHDPFNINSLATFENARKGEMFQHNS